MLRIDGYIRVTWRVRHSCPTRYWLLTGYWTTSYLRQARCMRTTVNQECNARAGKCGLYSKPSIAKTPSKERPSGAVLLADDFVLEANSTELRPSDRTATLRSWTVRVRLVAGWAVPTNLTSDDFAVNSLRAPPSRRPLAVACYQPQAEPTVT